MTEPMTERMGAYIAGDLAPDERRRFETELARETELAEEWAEQTALDLALRTYMGDNSEDERLVAAANAVLRGKPEEKVRTEIRARIETGRRRTRLPPAPARRTPFGPLGWIAAIAAAVLVVVGVRIYRDKVGPQPLAIVASVRHVAGQAYLVSGNTRTPLRRNQMLPASATVVTVGPASHAVLAFPDKTTLSLAADTSLRLADDSTQQRKHARAERGTITADVPPQAEGCSMLVSSPHLDLRVIGTRFRVEVERFATQIDMRDGSADASHHASGRTIRLAAGRALRANATGLRLIGPLREDRGWPAGLVALYRFEEGSGSTVHDVSKTAPPLDLQIADPANVTWLPGGGLVVTNPTLISSQGPAAKILEPCTRTEEFTVEVLVKPDERILGTGLPRIVELKYGRELTCFHVGTRRLGQSAWRSAEPWCRYAAKTCASAGCADLSDDRTFQLVHVTLTRAADGRTTLYVNGHAAEPPAPDAATAEGSLGAWSPKSVLTLADLATPNDRTQSHWLGEYHLVAIYARALSEREIRRNQERVRPMAGRSARLVGQSDD